MRRNRLRLYRKVLERLDTERVALHELLMAVGTVTPAQLEGDLGSIGVEPEAELETAVLALALTNSLKRKAPARRRAPGFENFEYDAWRLPGLEPTRIAGPILGRLHSGQTRPAAEWALSERALGFQLVDSQDGLLALSAVRGIRPRGYQIRTVKRFIHRLHGSGIVADEVGLGKTIEAGLIIKEYLLRGLVERFLILVPAALVGHWDDKLRDYFTDSLRAARGRPRFTYKIPENPTESLTGTGILISIDKAKGRYSEYLQGRNWDLVVVDECHMLKNHRTQNFKFVYSLSKRFTLLISATPIQNEIRDLYNLVNICKPGTLSTWASFKDDYLYDRRRARDTPRLRRLLRSSLTRTRRAEATEVQWAKRIPDDIEVELSEKELKYHEAVFDYVRKFYEKYARGSVILGGEPEEGVPQLELLLILILKELASSKAAVAGTLSKALREHVVALCERKGDDQDLIRLDQVVAKVRSCRVHAKLATLLANLDDWTALGKMIIFTEFRPTQQFIAQALRQRGIQPAIFRGDPMPLKVRAREQFEGPDCPVMISTEAGAQGLDFQFANVVVNFDFPWNPMRLEQRIGRVDRFGQERPVYVMNLFAKDTIEMYILEILWEKLRMASRVVGEIGAVLGFVVDEHEGDDVLDLETNIGQILLDSTSWDDVRDRFEELGSRLKAATKVLTDAQRTTKEILDEP